MPGDFDFGLTSEQEERGIGKITAIMFDVEKYRRAGI